MFLKTYHKVLISATWNIGNFLGCQIIIISWSQVNWNIFLISLGETWGSWAVGQTRLFDHLPVYGQRGENISQKNRRNQRLAQTIKGKIDKNNQIYSNLYI